MTTTKIMPSITKKNNYEITDIIAYLGKKDK